VFPEILEVTHAFLLDRMTCATSPKPIGDCFGRDYKIIGCRSTVTGNVK
jgi:hypothetical protein